MKDSSIDWLFLDTEFTGLHQHCDLISLGIVSASGDSFYAELSDFDQRQLDDWLREHVISQLEWFGREEPVFSQTVDGTRCYGDRAHVANALSSWLSQFEKPMICVDCGHWDWVLFCQLFGGAFHLPKVLQWRSQAVFPLDILGVLQQRDMDQIDRADFSGLSLPAHHALNDALVLRACFERIVANRWCEFSQ